MNKKSRIIDADTFLEWFENDPKAAAFWGSYGAARSFNNLTDAINNGVFNPDPIPLPTINPGDEVKQLKEDNARLTCQFTGAEQKYLTQSNVIAELRGRAERAEEREQREQKLKEAMEIAIRDGGKYENPYESLVYLQSFLSTLYPLDMEDTNGD